MRAKSHPSLPTHPPRGSGRITRGAVAVSLSLWGMGMMSMGLSEVVSMGVVGVGFVAGLPFLMSWVEKNLMDGRPHRD